MSKVVIFVDESGTLPDPKDKVIVVAAIGTDIPSRFEAILKEVKKKGKFKKQTGELKFYTAGEKTKTAFFEKLSKEKIDVFILTVEKMGRKIPDSPQNFAVLCWLLLSEVLNFYPSVEEIIFDRHFHREKDITIFNQFLKNWLEKLPQISHVDSRKDKRINVADMIAGAVLAKETRKEEKFYQIFRKQIISEIRINWPEAKRRLFYKKLA